MILAGTRLVATTLATKPHDVAGMAVHDIVLAGGQQQQLRGRHDSMVVTALRVIHGHFVRLEQIRPL